MLNRFLFAMAIAVAGFMVAGLSPAVAQDFVAELSGQNAVPPTDSTATGALEASAVAYGVSARRMTFTIECSGLTGPITAAHFHGPAEAGANADPVVPIEGDACPLEGTVTLNAEQAGQLDDELLYVNIHTAANPDGEIRGQVLEDS